MVLDFGSYNGLFSNNDLLSSNVKSVTISGPDFTYDSDSSVNVNFIQLSGNNNILSTLKIPNNVTINNITLYGYKISGVGTCRVNLIKSLNNSLSTNSTIATINITTAGIYSLDLNSDEIDNNLYTYIIQFLVGSSTIGQLSYVTINYDL